MGEKAIAPGVESDLTMRWTMMMTENIINTLENPEVKRYFLNVLDRDIPAVEKYTKFIEFFKNKAIIENKVMNRALNQMPTDNSETDKILSAVSQEMGLWAPQKILEETADSIRRAIGRLKKSRHRDGGWGQKIGISDFWGTCFAVLCLQSAKKLENLKFNVDIDDLIKKGIEWLQTNPHEWSIEHISPIRGISLYHVSLAIRCFSQSRIKSLQTIDIDRAIQCLIQSQNDEGGWDASIWGPEVKTPKKVYSEVGAVSMALQALAVIKRKDLCSTVEKAIDWLIKTQNPDGSWNNGSCSPGGKQFELRGTPVINKTCDALQGILVGDTFGIEHKPFEEKIVRAVGWLQDQERPILDENRKIKGWGWDYSSYDLEKTCLAQLPHFFKKN